MKAGPAEIVAPQDLDAEEAVLGALITAGGLGHERARAVLVDVDGAGLDSSAFYRPTHRDVFSTIRLLVERGEPCDAISVAAELQRQGKGEELKVRIHELSALAPATANAGHHAAIVVEQAIRRKQLTLSARLQHAALNGGVEADPVLAVELERVLAEIHGATTRGPNVLVPTIVPLAAFIAVEEAGAGALVGAGGAALIPEGGDVMVYGDGGAGKTTLAIDLACHLAAGDPWLGMPVTRPSEVLLVEDEGPRALFRTKLRHKLEGWTGSALGDRIHVFEDPWARFTFAESAWRKALAEKIRELEIDVLIVGPLTRAGMNEAGTLQDVAAFMELVAEVRRLAGRHITVVLIHHENKGGQVSGAWEGSGDTLLHVKGQGHGHTRLFIQKARWASQYHATALQLRWTDGEGFEVEDKPELDDDTLAEQLFDFISKNPGTTWTKVETATPGVNKERRRAVRDVLFAGERIVNVVKEDGEDVALLSCPERRPSRLYQADDPAISHLRRAPGAVAAQAAPARGAGEPAASAPCAPPLRGAGVGAAAAHPDETIPTELGWR